MSPGTPEAASAGEHAVPVSPGAWSSRPRCSAGHSSLFALSCGSWTGPRSLRALDRAGHGSGLRHGRTSHSPSAARRAPASARPGLARPTLRARMPRGERRDRGARGLSTTPDGPDRRRSSAADGAAATAEASARLLPRTAIRTGAALARLPSSASVPFVTSFPRRPRRRHGSLSRRCCSVHAPQPRMHSAPPSISTRRARRLRRPRLRRPRPRLRRPPSAPPTLPPPRRRLRQPHPRQRRRRRRRRRRPTTPAPTVGATAAPTLPPASALDWRACGAPFECATLQVPLDYANPAGEQIPIALIRLPAGDPSRQIGSLLINPGGPGGSGVDFLRSRGRTVSPQTLRDRFDIVGFDPRGVGASTPSSASTVPHSTVSTRSTLRRTTRPRAMRPDRRRARSSPGLPSEQRQSCCRHVHRGRGARHGPDPCGAG